MTPREAAIAPLPQHWSPEQALAVNERLHALREALWAMYGTQVQQAWARSASALSLIHI